MTIWVIQHSFKENKEVSVLPDWHGEYDSPEEKPEVVIVSPMKPWVEIVLILITLIFVAFFVWPINLPLILWGFIISPDQMRGWLGRLFLWASMTLMLMFLVGCLITFFVWLYKGITAFYKFVFHRQKA